MFDLNLSAEQVLFLPVLWIAVIFHEVAHAYAAWLGGDDTAARQGRLTLNPIAHIDPIGTLLIPILMLVTSGIPLIGWAKPVPVNPMRFKSERWKIVVALAGVFVNFCLAILTLIAMKLFLVFNGPAHLSENMQDVNLADLGLMMMRGLLLLNLVLMLFNLLPIPPLDGSHIFLYFIRTRNSVAFKIFEFMEQYSLMVLIMFVWILAPFIFPVIIEPILMILSKLAMISEPDFIFLISYGR